jgi:uncharacterized protein YcbX
VRIGTVSALYRYPVKAMAAEPLREAELGWFGLPGDRRYAFVQTEHRGDFPWLTIRQVPDLTRYVVTTAEPPRVRTPGGRELPVTAPELRDELADAFGGPVHLHRDKRGLFDAFPVSVVSVQTVAALGRLAGAELDPRRFRPTIVIDAPADGDFPEETLLGRTVTLGDAQIRVNVRDERCMVVNFDPDTAERNPAVLRAAAAHRETCVAVYGSVVRPGVVRVGDPVQAA